MPRLDFSTTILTTRLPGMLDSPTAKATSLSVRDLHLWRGEHHLLRGVTFEVKPGELLQVNGANGVGKTSLLRCVAGLLPTESGEIYWQGQSIAVARHAFHEALLYLGHSSALKVDLTAWENLRFAVGLSHDLSRSAAEQALQQLKIPQCIDLPIRVLSAGQRRRVALARLLLHKARVWILDEPITNLDVAGIALVELVMATHLARNGIILVAAHQPLLADHPAARSLQLH